ncbi:MAG: LysR family transcriptional regulator [Woeseia sp.]
MKLQQILTFVAVYQERSFTAAAERIHATQSGLSMQIKELEERIGTKLFERSPKGVDPTVAGQKLYARALEVVRQVEGLREELRNIRDEVAGTVSVGLMPTFTRSAIAPVIADFAAASPYVNFKIFEAYSAVLSDMVRREQLDFAIVPPTADTDGLVTEYIARDRELFVTTANTDRAHLEPVALREVQPLKLIVPGEGNTRRRKLERYFSTLGVTVDARIEMDAMMATLSLIEHSDWCAILPATLCHADIRGDVRKLHPLEGPELSVDYILISPAATIMSSVARSFADQLVQQIRDTCKSWETTPLSTGR